MEADKQYMWDVRYLQLAQQVASWSKDPSTKVGCVLVDPYGRPLSFGFNGFAKGLEDTPQRWNNRETKYRLVLHAESNALLNASGRVDDCTAYVTKPTCVHCISQLKQAKVDRIVFIAPTEEFCERWDMTEILCIAEELNIPVTIYNEDELM